MADAEEPKKEAQEEAPSAEPKEEAPPPAEENKARRSPRTGCWQPAMLPLATCVGVSGLLLHCLAVEAEPNRA